MSSEQYIFSSTENGFTPIKYDTVPSGTITLWSSINIPKGWSICDGTNGTPDLRGKFPLGWGYSNHSDYPPYSMGGNKTVTLEEKHIPSHTHKIQKWNEPTLITNVHNNANVQILSKSVQNPDGYTSDSFIVDTNLNSYYSSTPHNNMPPYIVLNFIIKL